MSVHPLLIKQYRSSCVGRVPTHEQTAATRSSSTLGASSSALRFPFAVGIAVSGCMRRKFKTSQVKSVQFHSSRACWVTDDTCPGSPGVFEPLLVPVHFALAASSNVPICRRRPTTRVCARPSKCNTFSSRRRLWRCSDPRSTRILTRGCRSDGSMGRLMPKAADTFEAFHMRSRPSARIYASGHPANGRRTGSRAR